MDRRGARAWIAVCAAALALASPTVSGVVLPAPAGAAETAPVEVQPPTITGTARPGETLTASPGTWTGDPTGYTYRWQACYPSGACLPRQESTASTYLVGPEDALKSLSVAVTAVNGAGAATATSPTVKVEPSWHYATGPPRVETMAWGAQRPSPPWSTSKALAIGVSTGMCVGEAHPRLGRIKVRERPPSSRFPFPSAVITTSVVWPAPTEVVGTVHPGEVGPGCAGIGTGAGRTIRLRRPVSRLFIYDGSQSPPRLVLQPPKILPWKLERQVGPKTIEIGVRFAACPGISITTHLVERPGRAIITAYGEPPVHKGPGRCLRVRGVEDLKVRLKARVNTLDLFDGSSDPARRRRLAGR